MSQAQTQQPQGQYEFSARPALLMNRPGPSAQQFKDPYREYIKVAPQNIMFDRRVVRGNTFAALVIPVNMQPDPMMMQQQQQIKEAKRRHQMEMIRNQQIKEQQMKEGKAEGMSPADAQMQQQQVYHQQMAQEDHLWGDLSDHENMVDEDEIEPDYYIDRAPDAIFIPNQEGDDKPVQVYDKDLDLFDFDLECEPILQVLVGKVLEHARIEAIEEYEERKLAKHKAEFKQMKEAELMETQRVEAARNRKNEEIERRNMQMRTQRAMSITADEKVTSRVMAKQFLIHFKRDTLRQLVDLGQLRPAQDFALGSHFVPQLYTQAWLDIDAKRKQEVAISEALSTGLKTQTLRHKQAILNEINRKAEAERQRILREKKEAEAKQARKERRYALREQVRIRDLQEIILARIVQANPSMTVELVVSQVGGTPVYDVAEPNMENKPQGIHVLGGMLGELLVTFSSIMEYTHASPAHETFNFRSEDIESFLIEMLTEDFAENICVMRLKENIKTQIQSEETNFNQKVQEAVAILSNAEIHEAHGLRFIINHSRDQLKIMPEVMEAFFKAVSRVALKEPKAPQEVPVIEEGADEAAITIRDNIVTENEQTERENEELAKMQTRIRFAWPEPEAPAEQVEGPDGEMQSPPAEEAPRQKASDEMDATAFVRVQNYKEPPPDDVQGSQDGALKEASKQEALPAQDSGTVKDTDLSLPEKEEELFNYSSLSTKVILAKPENPEFDINLIVHHTEAGYALRKHIIEKAKVREAWAKDLKEVSTNEVLAVSAKKSKLAEQLFEEELLGHGFNSGEKFEDTNLKIIYKTFLKQNDPRLLSPTSQH